MTILAVVLAGLATALGIINGISVALNPDPYVKRHCDHSMIGWFGVTALFLMVAK